jgi:hypothetical protein
MKCPVLDCTAVKRDSQTGVAFGRSRDVLPHQPELPLLASCQRQIHAEKMATTDPVCQRKKPGFPGLFLRIDEA